MNNLLIVESKNDVVFIRALIKHLGIDCGDVDGQPICEIDDFACLGGLDKTTLVKRLNEVRDNLPKKRTQAIGIVLDHDGRRKERIQLINDAVRESFGTQASISNTGEFVSVETVAGGERFVLNVACYLVNVDGKGELETLLKLIKSKDSPHADCLEDWRRCVAARGAENKSNTEQKIITDKEFDKFWLNNYIRFDTCAPEEMRQAGRKCSIGMFENVLENKKDIFNLDHPILDEFKRFLQLFQA